MWLRSVKKMNNKTKNLTIASIVSIATIASIMAFVTDSQIEAENVNVVRAPAPRELSMWGQNATSFDDAKKTVGFTTINMPLIVPADLTLKNIRVLQSEDQSFKLLTLIYAPEKVSTSDRDTFEDVMENGGMFALYSYEEKSPSFSWDKWSSDFASKKPTIRNVMPLNDQQALVVKGDVAKKINTQIFIHSNSDDIMLNLVSLKHDETELLSSIKSTIP